MTEINNRIAVQKEAGRVFYLHGHLPVFQPERKHFIDTLKMVAYRAESSMASLLREHMARSDQAIEQLLADLNATQTVFPGTQLTVVFKLGPS